MTIEKIWNVVKAIGRTVARIARVLYDTFFGPESRSNMRYR